MKTTRYWFKLLTNSGVLYLNKAHAVAIKPLELSPLA
jgi:predicted GNAT superfamily acetyltransferase